MAQPPPSARAPVPMARAGPFPWVQSLFRQGLQGSLFWESAHLPLVFSQNVPLKRETGLSACFLFNVFCKLQVELLLIAGEKLPKPEAVAQSVVYYAVNVLEPTNCHMHLPLLATWEWRGSAQTQLPLPAKVPAAGRRGGVAGSSACLGQLLSSPTLKFLFLACYIFELQKYVATLFQWP